MLDCIVQHESGGEQFRSDGTPVWSPTDDVGVMQIHISHIKEAKSMGLDVVNNEKDNIEYGIYLYEKYGPTQWTTYKSDCGGADTS